jgi:ankyrin repeat protein
MDVSINKGAEMQESDESFVEEIQLQKVETFISLSDHTQPRVSLDQRAKAINWNFVMNEIENEFGENLKKYLVECGAKIDTIRDDKGFSLLHHAVLKGADGKVNQLIDIFNEQCDESALPAWLNARTAEDKFTPLHFASFKGNVKAIETLINHGADVHLTNGFGLNMLHVAA